MFIIPGRNCLFTNKVISVATIPPTAATVLEHNNRVAIRLLALEGQALERDPAISDPSQWDGTKLQQIPMNGLHYRKLPSRAENC
jgi:hypothetical protein